MNLHQEVLNRYFSAIFDTDPREARTVIDEALASGMTPEEVVFEIILPSMNNMIANLVANDQATLSQHFVAAKIGAEIVESLLPKFKVAPVGAGVVIMGTSPGDFHGLGKKIVGGCLRANMFEVYDVGMNKSAETFVEAALEHDAAVIAVSSMMMHTAMSESGALGVRALLKEQGLEQRIKIAVGGAPYKFDDELYRKVQADGWAPDAISAVSLMVELVKEVHHA